MVTTARAFGSTKRDGSICIYPGCFRVIATQKFIEHFKVHLNGQPYSTACRDQYERALLDPGLLDLVEEGPLKAVFVASLHRISHVLDTVQTRLSSIEIAVQSSPAAIIAPPVVTQPVVAVPAIAVPVEAADSTTATLLEASQPTMDSEVESNIAATASDGEEVPAKKTPSSSKAKKKRAVDEVVGTARWSSRKKTPRS